MRLQALYLIGAVAVTAMPLSAGAQSLPEYDQSASNAQAADQPAAECPTGWVWEQAGYAKHGKWRDAHCAPRGMPYWR